MKKKIGGAVLSILILFSLLSCSSPNGQTEIIEVPRDNIFYNRSLNAEALWPTSIEQFYPEMLSDMKVKSTELLTVQLKQALVNQKWDLLEYKLNRNLIHDFFEFTYDEDSIQLKKIYFQHLRNPNRDIASSNIYMKFVYTCDIKAKLEEHFITGEISYSKEFEDTAYIVVAFPAIYLDKNNMASISISDVECNSIYFSEDEMCLYETIISQQDYFVEEIDIQNLR